MRGSGALIRWLLDNDLVDEINLFIFPVVVSPPNGKTLASYEKMSERDVKDAIDKLHAAYSS